MVLLAAVSAFALSIEGPSAVYLTSSERTVSYLIENPSTSPIDVTLSVVSPLRSQLSRTVLSIPARSSASVQVTFFSRPDLENQSYVSTLIAESDSELVTKRLTLELKDLSPREPVPDANAPDTNDVQPGPTGWFSLSLSPSVSAWFTTENLLNGVLLVLAVVLFIAFVSRLLKASR